MDFTQKPTTTEQSISTTPLAMAMEQSSRPLIALNWKPSMMLRTDSEQATLAKGKEDNTYILQESDLLKGFTDHDVTCCRWKICKLLLLTKRITMTNMDVHTKSQRQRNNQAQLHR